MAKYSFNTVDNYGNEVELYVMDPTPKQLADAKKVYGRTWREFAEEGVPVKATIERIARDQGIWDDEKEKELQGIQKQILEIERKLKGGGSFYGSVEEAKDDAIAMRRLRNKMYESLIEKSALDNNSAESQAENVRIAFLISTCTYSSVTKLPYFKSLDDYYARSSEKAALDATNKFLLEVNKVNLNFEHDLPENKFLRDYGFMDEAGRLIIDGHFVDDEGRRVDENGRFIDDDGQFVDINGNLVDENGEYKVDFKPFVDSEGKEIKPKN